MKSITDIKKDLLEVQMNVTESVSIPSELQEEIQQAIRDAWYHLTYAGTLIEESKIFEQI